MNIKIENTGAALEDARVIVSSANSFESLVSTMRTVKQSFESNWTGDNNEDRDSIISGLENSIKYYNNYIIPALSKLGTAIDAYAIATEQLAAASVGNPTITAGMTPSEYYEANRNIALESEPDFSNADAWGEENPYSEKYRGQCTWYAWGKFKEAYGFDPGFGGHGKECVDQLLKTHPDKFYASKEPVAGAVFSTVPFDSDGFGHVGMITKVEGDLVTYFDGNYDGYNNSMETVQNDCGIKTVSLSEFKQQFGSMVHFANPIETFGNSNSDVMHL